MTIAQFGTFDVDNYGDLLFPFIARWRCPEIEWLHVSPLGGKPGFADALPTIGFAEARKARFDAVIVGGGNIISARYSNLSKYRSIGITAYPSLSIGAAMLASRRKIPLSFNGPSILTGELGKTERGLLEPVLSSAAYVALRDSGSMKMASDLCMIENGAVVPDTVFDLARMWPKETLLSEVAKKNGYISIHVNSRYVAAQGEMASIIKSISDKRGQPLSFVPIAPCHGDVETANVLASEIGNRATVLMIDTLRNVAREIAVSSLYVGSSMHGFITAVCYGVPALLVLEGKNPMRKFMGVLDAIGASPSVICRSWADARDSLESAFVLSPEKRYEIQERLDAHWLQIKKQSATGKICRMPLGANLWPAILKLLHTKKNAKKFLKRILKAHIHHDQKSS